MGWSLGYLPSREPERLDEFFLAVGKALYLANEYEAKCGSVLQIARLECGLRDGLDIERAIAICKAMKKRTLHATLDELQKRPPSMKDADVKILDRAKVSRNFIAHEAATLGPLSSVTASTLKLKLSELRSAVSALAIGDNLISRWIYEIEEQEPAPFTIAREYPKWVDEWVFGGEHGA
jgi:hypothetical protein